jgi:3-deoxy-D-manno-octulosonic acid kinase
MHERGLPVPQPLAASYWRARFTYRAALITELIPNASTLAGALERYPAGAVADAIYAMHEAGVWHADLNAFNILIDGEGKVWLVDFDRGRRCVMGPGRRKANLLRLRRSLIKTAGATGERAWEEINRAYAVLAVGSEAENAL